MNRPSLKLSTKAAITLVVLLFAKIASADVTIDNFSCSDSVTLDGPAGPSAFENSFIACPGSLGGEREDFIENQTPGASGGSASSVSTITTDTAANSITGTFGSGITGTEGMVWGVSGDLNLDLVGDSILVQVQSDSAGILTLLLGPPTNNLGFTATFSGSPGYQDVLIPLTNPTVNGTGSNLADITAILLSVELDTPGATWSIDEAKIVPEPSTLLLTGICLLGVVTKSLRRRSPR